MKQKELNFRAWSEQRKSFVRNCYPCGSGENYGFDLCGIVDDGDNELEDDGLVLMQYIGIKDKNGKKIFEGDIFDVHQTINGQSKFIITNCIGGYDVKYAYDPNRDYEYDAISLLEIEELEIIGNIYENEGLLAVAP